MLHRGEPCESACCDMPMASGCCEEHRRHLLKFEELSRLLPNINMSGLALHFARQCPNNKKAARTARRLSSMSKRPNPIDESSTSPFQIVDRLIASPTGIYAPELTSRPFQECCSGHDLKLSFERYVKELPVAGYNIIPFAFDVQLKYRSLSFLSKEQTYTRLTSMTRVQLRETKINRAQKGSMIQVRSIVDPFLTPRSIQSIVEDDNGHLIRLAIYNWHMMLVDQTSDSIRNRLQCGKSFMIGNPFVKMAADGLLMLRVDDPRLEMWFFDYEKELEDISADRLRELGNKCFGPNDTYGAIEYYTLGLSKNPNDIRLLNNRAERYLRVQLPHLALADCERILDIYSKMPGEQSIDAMLDWKVYYRKVRALLGLQWFDEAKRAIEPLLERCQEVSGTHNEIVDRFRRIIETDIPRAQRKAEGHYDMLDAHVEEADEFAAEFDRADAYEFRPCETQGRGYGMFARRPLAPGTLLFVERPFVYVQPKSNETLLDQSVPEIYFSITQKPESRYSDDVGTSVGRYLRQSSLDLLKNLETRILIDPKHSLEALSYLTPLRQHNARKKSDDDDYPLLPYRILLELYERNVIGSGLWTKLARFNHSCLPNCLYLVVNRLCFVSVLKPIDIGEEMTVCYLPTVYSSYIERRVRLREFYIDECQCELCAYDREVGRVEMQQLCWLFEDTDEDENKRRYIFKYLISQFSSSRPLGFVEQMSRLHRPVTVEIFLEQVKHGYLTHPHVLDYLLSHLHRCSQLKAVVDQLKQELAYFNWPADDEHIPEAIATIRSWISDAHD